MKAPERIDVDEMLRDWGRERPDLDMSPLRITLLLRRVFEAADRRRNALLAEYDLSTSALDLLSVLRRLGPPHRSTPSELAELMLISAGGVTQRLARLVDAGLVQRSIDPDDRRSAHVQLTKRGVKLVDAVLAPYMEQERQMLSTLGAKERETLERLLARMLDAIRTK